LEDRGCEAAGYRLSGDVVDQVCCRHLYGSRPHAGRLTTWPRITQSWFLSAASHDGSCVDVYGQLLAALAIAALGDEREKPPCCHNESDPPEDGVASEIADAVERWARRRRRAADFAHGKDGRDRWQTTLTDQVRLVALLERWRSQVLQLGG